MPTPTPSDPPHLQIAIVASSWYEEIIQSLVRGARDAFHEASGDGGGRLTVINCPGTWEIPLAVMTAWETLDPVPDAFVALGCVIKGETSHDRWINAAVCTTLADLSVRMGLPVALGVLTCDTMAQAKARAGGDRGNKGSDAMKAAMEQVMVLRTLSWDRLP